MVDEQNTYIQIPFKFSLSLSAIYMKDLTGLEEMKLCTVREPNLGSTFIFTKFFP